MKNKILILVVTFVLLSLSTFSQTSNWKTKGSFGINASQTSFNNWAAGGDKSLSGNSFFNYSANYKKDKLTWDNSLDLGIGYMKQGESEFFKTDDRIVLSSKVGREAFEHWYYSGSLGFRTQFTDGYKSISDNTKVSNFMAPGYITVSIGMDFKKIENLTVLMSPIAARTTFVLDTLLSNAGAYGVEKGESIRNEFGGFMKIEWNKEVFENVSYKTNLELFSNYLEKPQNIDLNWEHVLAMKINSFLTVNVHLSMIYDDDIPISYDSTGDGINDKTGPKLQLRNIMGIGLGWKF